MTGGALWTLDYLGKPGTIRFDFVIDSQESRHIDAEDEIQTSDQRFSEEHRP